MKFILTVLIALTLQMSDAISQTIKFKIIDITNGKPVENLIVYPSIESCDFVSTPLIYDAKSKLYLYKNKSFPNPAKLALQILSPEYYFEGGSIVNNMRSFNLISCKKEDYCLVLVEPSIKISFISKMAIDGEISLILKAKCNKIDETFFHQDRILYQEGVCKMLNDSISEFSFPITEEEELTIYFKSYTTLLVVMKCQNGAQIYKKEYFLSPKLKEIKINVGDYIDCKLRLPDDSDY